MGASSTTTGKLFRQVLFAGLLLVIPLIVLFTSLKTITARDKAWYGGGYDPEYAYLFNSLNMARFRLAGHIDHPGTTMQVTGGIVLQGAWMLDQRDESLTKAVLSDPEHYIRILNIATAAIGALALFLLAFYLSGRTGNPWFALLFQLTPFISGFILFNGFTRITQELMLMMAALALAAVSLVRYFDNGKQPDRSFIFLFGLITGFGMASKILFAPLMVVPLILIGTMKERFRFLAISAVSFLVFTLPVARLYPNMLYWIYRLFIHTGQYGTGSKGVINTGVYFDELVNLFSVSPVLAAIFGVSILVLLIILLAGMVGKQRNFNPAARLLLAVTLAQAAGYLLVAKQPKEAYLLPYESLAGVNAILMVHLIVSAISPGAIRNVVTGALTLCSVFLVIPYGLARKAAIYTADRNPVWENAWQAATGYRERTAVICANPGSSPVAGLNFGNAYSIRRYVTDLQGIYPDFYILDAHTGLISHWGERPLRLDSLFNAYRGNIIYSGPPIHDQALKDVFDHAIPGRRFATVYSDGYQVLMAPVEEGADGMVAWRKLIFNGAEASPLTPEKVLESDGIEYPGLLSYERSFAGRSSIIANPQSPYAFSIKPDLLQPGDSIEATVMVSGNPEDVRLVLSGEDAATLYLTASADQGSGTQAWYPVTLKTVIPETTVGKNIKLYAWNKGKHPVYFDNFRMGIYRPTIKLTSDGSDDGK